MLNLNSKIFVAGHNGLLGSSICRVFKKNGYKNLIMKEKKDLDLNNKAMVDFFFNKERPDFIILAAGKTGGILENKTNPLGLILNNLEIQTNVMSVAIKYKVNKLLFFGSTCMYPSSLLMPLEENMLLSGKPEISSLPYAIAKLSGVQLSLAYNFQANKNIFLPLIPNSIYGPNDNFDHNSGHVLSSLLSKFHDAKVNNLNEVTLWGTGVSKREFVYVDDLSEACLLILKKNTSNIEFPINIGSGEEISILDLAKKISKIVNFKGNIIWDESKPDGVKRKFLSSNRIKDIGWEPKVNIDNGLKLTYQWYLNNN